MRLFGGQVHVLELMALAGVTFMGYALGYSLPIFAAILILLWPLLLLQMVFEGLLIGIGVFIARLWRRGRPAKPEPERAPAPPRTGVARYLWYLPLLAVTAGYATHVRETGRWFL